MGLFSEFFLYSIVMSVFIIKFAKNFVRTMKNFLCYVVLMSFFTVLASCDKSSVDEELGHGFTDIELYADFAVEHVSMDMPDTKVALGDVVKSIDFMVYSVKDGTYSEYKSAQQSAGADDFGRLSLNHLAYGEYILIAVGHNCSVRAHFYSPAQIDFEGKVNETFVAYKRLVVNGETEKGQTMTMKRISSMFSIKVEDAQPAEVTTVEFQLTGASTDFNPSTGLAYSTNLTVRTVTIDVSEYAGFTERQYWFHMFLPDTDAVVSVVASFKDSEGNVLYQRSFPSVEMTVNEKTIYSGSVYSVSSSLSVGIESDWNRVNNYKF